MPTEKIKEYTNGKITVVWKPGKCIHAAACVTALPQVYKPKEKPWIQIENATTEQLKKQVKTCPSGALTFFMNSEAVDNAMLEKCKIEVLENGPLIINGTLEVEHSDGSKTTKSAKTAFCRCGASGNKPYCDGMHIKNGFQG